MQSARFIRPKSLAGHAIRHAAGLLVPDALDRRFKPLVTEADRERLRAYYRPHNQEISELLEIDLQQYWS
jgi:hypothetical protein